ncbi:hypothetical protein AB0H57_29615 [Micromonospora sp. NPDC050686]|uniref:hypothetical protein n=1 Tax=Micromonospora sp. NPDC050686 TaxID=3154631 RepID=UPI0033F7D155
MSHDAEVMEGWMGQAHAATMTPVWRRRSPDVGQPEDVMPEPPDSGGALRGE